MKRKFTFLIAAAFMLLTMMASTGEMWGQTRNNETATLTQSNLGLTGSYTTNTEKTIGGIKYVYTDLMKNNDNIQAKASTGTIKNTTAYPGDIVSVAITHSGTARSTTISGSANGTDWTTIKTGEGSITGDFTKGSYKYFKITRGSNAAYWTQIVITYSTGSSTYTVTYDDNGATSGAVPTDNNTYESGDAATVLGNTGSLAKTGNTWSGWTREIGGTPKTYSPGDSLIVKANTTLLAKWTTNTHTVTMPTANTYGSYTMDQVNPVEYGTTVTLTYGPNAGYESYIATWSVNGTPIVGNSFVMPDEDVNITVVISMAPEWILTDIEDIEPTDVFVIVGTVTSGNYYMSNAATNASPAATTIDISNGKIASNVTVTNSMKWNVSGNSTDGYIFYPNGSTTTWLGVNTTASSGNNTNLRVGTENRKIFEANGKTFRTKDTYTARYWNVYASGPDWRGYVSNSTNTTVSFYKYCIPSNIAKPTFDLESGTYIGTQNVTISCATEGVTIYYTLDGTNPSNTSTEYTQQISIAETCTLKAVAYKEGNYSYIAKAKYNIVQPYTSIETMFNDATNTETPVYITFNNYVVTGVSDNRAYVTDGTHGFVVYQSNHGFVSGNIINGTITETCNLDKHHGYARIQGLTNETDGLTVTTGGEVDVLNVAMSTLSGVNTGALICYRDLTFNETGGYLADNEDNHIVPYYELCDYNWVDEETYHVTGVYQIYDSNNEILPRSLSDVVNAADFDTDFSGLTTFTYVLNYGPSEAQMIEVYCDDLGTNLLTVTSSADYELCLTQNGTYTTCVEMSPTTGYVADNLYVRLKAGLTTGAHNGTLTFTAANLTTVEQALTGTVSATVTYDIIVDDNIDHGSIESDKAVAEAGETVNLTAHPDQYYQLGEWSVTDGVNDIDVVNNQFEMPDADVLVSATFTRIQYTITYSVNENTSAIPAGKFNAGEVANLPDATITGQTFIGWSTSASSTEVVKNYIPTADVTLFAVFGDVIEGDLTITKDTENFPDAYGEANTFTEYTLEGKKFKIQQAYVNNSKLQFRAAGNENGTGTIYNSEDFGRITSIVLVYNSSDSKKNFTIKAGTAENPTEGTSITPSISNSTYTFDLSDGTYHYFVMANGENAGYLDQIVINYEVSHPFTEVTNVTTDETIGDNILETERVIVANGATLTFNGTNNGTAANLVIEEGGQLVVPTDANVQATVKKAVGHGAKSTGNWYTISSPVKNVDPASVTNLIQATPANYDFYYYNEPSGEWFNHKAAGHNVGTMTNGRGYLYWNADGDELAFAGELNTGEVEVAVTAGGSGDLKGINLIGNPYSHNIYKGAGTAIPNTGGALATGFYMLSNSDSWVACTDNTTAIKPAQGILVKATEVGTVTMTNTTAAGTSKAGNDNIRFTVANNQYEDVAYAMFNNEIGLNKINHRNPEVPMLYIPQDGTNYAIATMSDDVEMFTLSFKTVTTGKYTLGVKLDGKYDYLHIVDRLTGEDIDMLAEGEYSFMGTPKDLVDRFIVKLSYNATVNDVNDAFAYQSGNEIIVNGEGELQIFDLMGRKVMTQVVNGVQTVNVPAQGVYIFRLNGKVQKIVVR